MAYLGFDKLKAKIAAKGGVSDPGAVAASIGRKKYGKAAFQKAAASGKSMRGYSHLPKGVPMTPTGDLGAHRAAEAKELGTFKGVSDRGMAGHWAPMREYTKIDPVPEHRAGGRLSNMGGGRAANNVTCDPDVGSGLAPKKASPFTGYADNTKPPKGRALPARGENEG